MYFESNVVLITLSGWWGAGKRGGARGGGPPGRCALSPGGNFCGEETMSPAVDPWFVQPNSVVMLKRNEMQVTIY